ncbi:hypothetical protein ACLOJK_000977 [Asimina triloba]
MKAKRARGDENEVASSELSFNLARVVSCRDVNRLRLKIETESYVMSEGITRAVEFVVRERGFIRSTRILFYFYALDPRIADGRARRLRVND